MASINDIPWEPISRAEMDQILAACGEHTQRDPHYHCCNCGGINSAFSAAHLDLTRPKMAFKCVPRSAVAQYGVTP